MWDKVNLQLYADQPGFSKLCLVYYRHLKNSKIYHKHDTPFITLITPQRYAWCYFKVNRKLTPQ